MSRLYAKRKTNIFYFKCNIRLNKMKKIIFISIKIILFNLLLTSCIIGSMNNESSNTGNDLDNVNFDYLKYNDSIRLNEKIR